MPPPRESENEPSDENDKEATQNSESNSLFLEDCRKSKQDKRETEEDNDNVDSRNQLGPAGGSSKSSSSIEGHLAHEWKRIPNNDTRDVEEQVSKSYLEGFHTVGDQ